MALNNANTPAVAVVHLGSLTTDATTVPAIHFPRKTEIVSVKVINGAQIAASDSAYVKVALKNGNDTVAEIDSREAHENGLEANEAKDLNLVAAEKVLAEGTDLAVLYNETGSVALTDAKLLIEYFVR